MSSSTIDSRPPAPPATVDPPRRRPAWALPVVVVAALAVAVALVVGVRGLVGDPVVRTAADGTATLSGSFQPVDCGPGCVQGYVQAGGRSVFVKLPAGCPALARDQHMTVTARPDTSLGKKAYLATGCATA